MPCDEWSCILDQYRSAVRIYSDAAGVLGVAVSIGFCKHWELSEEARKACGRLRADLLEQEHRHGCQVATGPAQKVRNEAPLPASGDLKPLGMPAAGSLILCVNRQAEMPSDVV
jgi:hypothetical protein